MARAFNGPIWKNTLMLTENERCVASAIEGDIDIDSEADPFAVIAKRTGLDEETVLDVIRRLRERGVIRRFGAVLRHQRAGVTENALVVWAVPAEDLERAGTLAARRPEVTHCYERTPPFQGTYRLFTMVHGHRRPLTEIIQDLASELGVSDYLVLESIEEFKKVSMEYFKL